jgi:hypothetical protein
MSITVDNSTLSAVAQCSTAALMRYRFGWTVEDSAPLEAGTAVHLALDTWVKNDFHEGVALEAMLKYYEGSEILMGLSPGDRLEAVNVSRIVTHWMRMNKPEVFPFKLQKDYTEVGFTVPLDDHGDFLLSGRLDALAPTETEAWWVIDWKTTGRVDSYWKKKWTYSSQVTGYVWAAQQHFEMPVAGAFIGGIELSKLPVDTKKCRTHGISFQECGPLHPNHAIGKNL